MRYFDGYDEHGEEKGLFAAPGARMGPEITDPHREPAPQTYGLSQDIVGELAQAYDANDAAEMARDRMCAQAPSMALLLIETRAVVARLGADDLLARINTVLVKAGVRPCPPG